MGGSDRLSPRNPAEDPFGALDETNRRGTRTRLLRFAPGVFTTVPFEHEYWEEVYLVPPATWTVGNDAQGNGGTAFPPNTYCLPASACGAWPFQVRRRMHAARNSLFRSGLRLTRPKDRSMTLREPRRGSGGETANERRSRPRMPGAYRRSGGRRKSHFRQGSRRTGTGRSTGYRRVARRRPRAFAFAGIPISVKDLFDLAGDVTRAGSKALADATPADRDAPAIARLRAAGSSYSAARTWTEFAFSGLGLNPHYGTPRNPYDRELGRIPGGSSSGAAISVTDDMAYGAIGTDTGGSLPGSRGALRIGRLQADGAQRPQKRHGALVVHVGLCRADRAQCRVLPHPS